MTMDAMKEYDIEVKRRNFTRAALVAEQADLGADLVEQARVKAFKQTVGEWFNFRGGDLLAGEWGFSAEKVRAICDELIAEFESREKREKRAIQVFDIDRMDHTHIVKLVGLFRDRY